MLVASWDEEVPVGEMVAPVRTVSNFLELDCRDLGDFCVEKLMKSDFHGLKMRIQHERLLQRQRVGLWSCT